MSKKNKQFLLFLINKFLDGSISRREISVLFYFFLNNQKNNEWPENFQDKAQVEAKIFNRIKATINDEKPVRVIPFYKSPTFKYVVAASVMLMVTIPFLINRGNGTSNTPTSVNNSILPGTNKATLTLDDGSLVTLDENQQFESNDISNDGKSLKYKNTNTREIAYNYLTIPRGGQYQLILSDGTQVWLNSQSQLKYPVSFKQNETRNVELLYGEAYFDVSPSNENNGTKFNVITSHHYVEVLGTEFNIKAYKDETSIYTTLVEGKVAVNMKNDSDRLIPDQQLTFNKTTGKKTVKTVDVYNAISWKNGIFSFENKPLKDIMKVLSRWYDVDVVFINEDLGNEEFIGVLGKEQKLGEILSTIKNFGTINSYSIDGKTVILK